MSSLKQRLVKLESELSAIIHEVVLRLQSKHSLSVRNLSVHSISIYPNNDSLSEEISLKEIEKSELGGYLPLVVVDEKCKIVGEIGLED